MDTKKAIIILKKLGYQVNKSGEGWLVQYPKFQKEYYSSRDLINFAREYTSEGQNTPVNRNVKCFRHKKNRAKTKEDLHHERWDNFDSNNLRQDDDIWNWD